MSKIKAKSRAKRGSTRRIGAKVIVHRTSEGGDDAFEACIRIGGGVVRGTRGDECAYGSNPRKAIARALTRLGRSLKDRQEGAFRGGR